MTAVADPQFDEDEFVERVRVRAGTPKGMAAQWRRYAASSRSMAQAEHHVGHLFAAELLVTRALVREAAAALLMSQSPTDAAAEMMLHARRFSVRTPPLVDYDSAAIRYTQARSWQWCAHQIDPSLPEVQARWPEA